MEDRVQLRFQNYVLRHKLGSDLSAVQANLSTEHLSVGSAWVVFSSMIEASTALVGILAQLGYILGTLRSSGHGMAFILFCLAQPVLEFAFRRTLFSIPSIVDTTDPHFLRMRSLRELREQKFRQEIITGDLVGYILQEFRRAVKLLGDTDVTGPYQQYARHGSSIPDLVTQLAGDLPMLYYAANAIWTPTKFSLASVATLHKSEQLLSWTFPHVSYSIRPAMRLINSVKMIYDLDRAAKQKEDGHLAYPPAGRPHAEGMPIELRNVSFSYPGAATKALNNVSLSLKAGQLIVIVGANGSGKSTVVKLLTRLYDATDGAVMIDGEDIKNYKTADVRRATASLTQDHQLYPLSLGENIGLGNPEQVTDLDMVRAAAKLGGAESVIAKQSEGLATVLKRPAGAMFSVSVHGTGNTPLSAEWERLRKNADVSGGERQRIAAARTFMRFTSNAVKLVCVDEPSANLDPEAEQELFNNLRAARAGKTTIFITHRFGHLTKHADLLVCMKDGTIAETGTHEELLALKGEYFKMYIIQAEAFN
ncbi:P-loop containing nucleoside triphosphate hydrolase protein [Mycena rebaudengoi]|nr:P-loop containing nucleoside triphosphate hydrolase protein [Mycena rebaudengoi]